MTIRIKLALILSLGISVTALASLLVSLQLQQKALRSSEDEKVRMVMEGVARMGEESLLAHDPLMLLDYLAITRKLRKEVLYSRALINGVWHEVRGAAASDKARENEAHIMRSIVAKSPDGDARPYEIEIYFSSSMLAERERKALEEMLRRLARAAGAVAAIGVLICIPLSRTLTKRIVVIEKTLEAIGQGKLGERAAAEGTDEIARLARGVNQMSERLKELEEMKKTFIASVTHELRSPLGAIESHLKGLLADPSRWQPNERENLERIRRNAARLEHFVTNLLEMSKIERGKLDYSPRLSDLAALAEDTVIFFGPKAKEVGLDLGLEVTGQPPAAQIDPDLISQVLANFISNAIKFTRPGGKIRVGVALRNGAAPPALECSVADTGVGLPPEALKRIFKPFERVKNPLRATGAGLGLAISKSIIEMHGGEIGVTSEQGRGSRFFFILPLKNKTARL